MAKAKTTKAPAPKAKAAKAPALKKKYEKIVARVPRLKARLAAK